MKSKFKSIKIILAVVLIVIIAAGVAIYIFAGSAVKIGIEAGATSALKVGVSVKNVDLSIVAGRIGLQGLVINNPAGYQYQTLLEIKDARAAVAISSLLSDKIDIKEVKLDGINLVIEQKGLTNNLQELINNISKPEKDKAVTKSEGAGKKLQIDNLEITNVVVKVKLLPMQGKSGTVELKLSPIRMTNLGSDNKMDIAELSGKVLVAIAGGVAEQGAGVLPDEITGPIRSGLKGIENLGGEALGEGGKVLKEGVDIGKGVTEGIQGLFKQKSDK
jgi:hypothetical protein